MGYYGTSIPAPPFLGGLSERLGATQAQRQSFPDQFAQQQMQRAYNQSDRGLSKDYFRSIKRFHEGCNRAIREIKEKNENNCITKEIN